MSQLFEKGAIVYVCEHWSGRIIKSVLADPCENGFEINYKYIVDKEGNELDRFVGNSRRDFDNIWFTAKDAFDEIARRDNAIIEQLASQIKSIEDLLRFPLEHCLDGEEYTDYNAIKAYKMKAKELIGVDL